MAQENTRGRSAPLLAGATLLLLVLIVPPPAGMAPAAWHTTGVALLMATWWMSGALPIPATSLVPLVAFPLLGIAPIREAAAPYADPIIYLFLGGFILGTAMQRWSLHVRIGFKAQSLVGTAGNRLVAGFLLATGLISMWVSNTATTIMMLPVAISVLALFDEQGGTDPVSRRNLGIGLTLAVAYGASMGGLATIIGTPTNAVLVGFMAREYQVQIGFAQWMVMGLPLSALLLATCWFVLTRVYPVKTDARTDASALVAARIRALGPITAAERRVAYIFAVTALLWIFRPLIGSYIGGLNDTVIAIAGALSLFFVPSGMSEGGRLLGWEDLRDLPWGVLLLFGGGLSLAAAISDSGLAAWLGTVMGALATWPIFAIVAIATVGMIFLTELTSNTASAAAFLPLAGAVALGIGFDPLFMTIPLAVAASCAFMLPVGTPPNAIAYASGRVSISEMVRAGVWLNLIGGAEILAVSYAMTGWLFAE